MPGIYFLLHPVEHRLLHVEGDDFTFRAYALGRGHGDAPRAAADIEHAHTGLDAGPVEQQLGAGVALHIRIFDEEVEAGRAGECAAAASPERKPAVAAVTPPRTSQVRLMLAIVTSL